LILRKLGFHIFRRDKFINLVKSVEVEKIRKEIRKREQKKSLIIQETIGRG
jgi:hypothetical protein